MKCALPLTLLILSTPVAAFAGDTLLPAGALIQCTISEPKLSSKTDKIGDPVLCQLSHVELYGRATVPYGSYLVGHFEDYKDPGHFVGKGWIELRFDRLVVQDTVVPLDARVVSVPKYAVDQDGRILGNGHAVKDTIEWFIPVLWPLDLINLPRRGPRVVLKPETRLTLKVMDDVGFPARDIASQDRNYQQPSRQPLIQRNYDQNYQNQGYQNQNDDQAQNYYPQPRQARTPAPIVQNFYNSYAPPQQQPQQQQQVVVLQQAPQQQVAQRLPPVVYSYGPPRYPPPYGYYGPLH